MGGLFSSPPPAPAMPAPPEDTSAEDERKHRIEAQARKRRGRAGTVRTSARGLLDLNDLSLKRKSLLGE